MIIFFSSTCTLSWISVFSVLSMSPSAVSLLAAPDFAVGWLVMRMTARLRMPLNLAIAAPLSRFVPALSELKVSPLLTVFAADEESAAKLKAARERLETSPKLSEFSQRCIQKTFSGFSKFTSWVEGPIDKYGLSYFLASKVTNVSTLTGATYLSMQGMDLPGTLSSWGLSGDLQADSGLLACTAALNVTFTPLHFYGSVATVLCFDRLATRLWAERQGELEEKEKTGVLTEEEDDHKQNLSEEHMRKAVVGGASVLALCFDLAVSLFIMRRMFKSGTKEAGKDAEDVSSTTSAEDEGANAPIVKADPILNGDTATA